MSDGFQTPKKSDDYFSSIRPSLKKEKHENKFGVKRDFSADQKADSLMQKKITQVKLDEDTKDLNNYIWKTEEHTVALHFANALLKKNILFQLTLAHFQDVIVFMSSIVIC